MCLRMTATQSEPTGGFSGWILISLRCAHGGPECMSGWAHTVTHILLQNLGLSPCLRFHYRCDFIAITAPLTANTGMKCHFSLIICMTSTTCVYIVVYVCVLMRTHTHDTCQDINAVFQGTWWVMSGSTHKGVKCVTGSQFYTTLCDQTIPLCGHYVSMLKWHVSG